MKHSNRIEWLATTASGFQQKAPGSCAQLLASWIQGGSCRGLSSSSLTVALLMTVSVPNAWAACSIVAGYQPRILALSMGTITIKEDTPVGGVVASQEFPFDGAGQDVYYCKDGGTNFAELSSGRPMSGDASKQYVDSGVPGIGIRVASIAAGGSVVNYYPFRESWASTMAVHFYSDLRTRVELIKTNAVTGTGSLATSTIGKQYGDGDPGRPIITVTVSGNGVSIVRPTCSVEGGGPTVPLGSVGKDKFTGPGTPAGARAFSVKLNCSPGQNFTSNVYMNLDAAPSPSNEAGVLQLTSEPGVASGVGIQVLDANMAPVAFKQDVKVGPPVEGSYVINYTARYYQTAPAVAPGKANGVANINLSYK